MLHSMAPCCPHRVQNACAGLQTSQRYGTAIPSKLDRNLQPLLALRTADSLPSFCRGMKTHLFRLHLRPTCLLSVPAMQWQNTYWIPPYLIKCACHAMAKHLLEKKISKEIWKCACLSLSRCNRLTFML